MKFFKLLIVATLLLAASCSVGRSRGISQDQAGELTARYLKEQRLRWGKPTRIDEFENVFWFIYKTPPLERQRKGDRLLVIDRQSGRVRAVTR